MSIEELITVLKPPRDPIDPGSPEQWSRVEEQLGTSLPPDYKDFIERYGTGIIDKFLRVYNPFAARISFNLLQQIPRDLDTLRTLKEDGESIPHPLFPESGGLLPWGLTIDGDIFFGVTTGETSEWTVCVNEGRAPLWEHFDESVTSFLAKFRTGMIRVVMFEDLPSERVGFLRIDDYSP